MAITNLIIRNGDDLEINFQSTIDLESFEMLLKRAYGPSRKKACKRVVFNFKKAYWCDVLSLSMIAQWLLELKWLDKELFVEYPSNRVLIDFFENYRFTDFLTGHEIPYVMPAVQTNLNFMERSVTPLTFTNKNEFRKMLAYLTTQELYAAEFNDEFYARVTSKNVLRDIIIKELGDNMYIHAGGMLSNVIVTKIGKTRQEYAYTPRARALRTGIADKNTIAVVISDKGAGIPKTLGGAYQKDLVISDKKAKPSGCDLITYSTLVHATSRSLEERMADIRELLSEDVQDMNPFTGLFQVRELVRKFMGILTIRSGDSFVIFNYYDKKGKETVYRSDTIPGYKSLAAFGGTQIKVVLPILEDYKAVESALYGKFNIKEADERVNYCYLPVASFFTDEKEIIKSCRALLDAINNKSMAPEVDSIILDLKCSQVSLDAKVKLLIIWSLMKSQEVNSKVHTVINIDPTLLSQINISLENKGSFLDQPMIVFTTDLNRDIIGVNLEERNMFLTIQRTSSFGDDERLADFANKYKTLFIYNKKSDDWSIKHNRALILDMVRERVEQQLIAIIRDVKNRIFYPETRVLSPRGKYFNKYFVICNLLENNDWRELVIRWLELELHAVKPTLVISIGRQMGECMAELIKQTEVSRLQKERLDHVIMESILDISRKEVSDLLYLKGRTSSVVVCTDVIATGETLTIFLNSLDNIQIGRCFCIVSMLDERELKMRKGNTTVPVSCVLRETAIAFADKPVEWSFDEVFEAQKETNKLFAAPRHQATDHSSIFESPLEKYGLDAETRRNPFLEDLVIPKEAFFLKVIAYGRYMPVMYNIPVILQEVKEDIRADLTYCIDRVREQYGVGIDYFVTTGTEEHYQSITSMFFLQMPAIKLLHLPYNHLDHYHSRSDDFSGKGLIVIDDAVVTGENFFKILEYYSSRKAAFILVYILIKRSSNKVTRRLKEIRKFGQTTVEFRHLFEGRLQVYSEANNPVLRNISEYENLLARYPDLPISDFIKERIAVFQYRDAPERAIPADSLNISKASFIRLRWSLMNAARNLVTRKGFAALFEEPNRNMDDILLLFSILVEEKYAFLYNKKFIEGFFNENPKGNVLAACSRILTDKKLKLSLHDHANTVEVLSALDAERLSDLVKYELLERLDAPNLIYAIICVLLLAPRNYQYAKIKMDLIKTLESPDVPLIELREFFGFLKQAWQNEEREMSGYDQNKATYIKELLKASFHELSQKVANLKYYLGRRGTMDLRDVQKAFSMFKNIISVVSEASKGFDQLFLGGSYSEVSSQLESKLKLLHDILKRSMSLMESISSENMDDFADYFLDSSDRLVDCLMSEHGILRMLDESFRTNAKAEFVRLMRFETRTIHVTFESTDESCMVFCTLTDLGDVIGNVRANIETHSKAERVLVRINKEEKDNFHMVRIDIYNDGPPPYEPSIGHGINNCTRVCKAYSGKFDFMPVGPEDERSKEGYTSVSVIELHDLSTEILNLPIYAS